MAPLEERIAYGRKIRERASLLLEAYGETALMQARSAADQPGLPAAERSFWASVAERIVRSTASVEPLAN
ncbi:MAG: hypothetical protein QM699_14965 [Amaricoccus sp.]|uniref:hypothetical protein n=1 Tax=Amaricoccus sp. TaxID=1872485 RepID=UPI0039E320B7